MATESFTNTVIINEDGLKCFYEILEKGKDYTYERSDKIKEGDYEKIHQYLVNKQY